MHKAKDFGQPAVWPWCNALPSSVTPGVALDYHKWSRMGKALFSQVSLKVWIGGKTTAPAQERTLSDMIDHFCAVQSAVQSVLCSAVSAEQSAPQFNQCCAAPSVQSSLHLSSISTVQRSQCRAVCTSVQSVLCSTVSAEQSAPQFNQCCAAPSVQSSLHLSSISTVQRSQCRAVCTSVQSVLCSTVSAEQSAPQFNQCCAAQSVQSSLHLSSISAVQRSQYCVASMQVLLLVPLTQYPSEVEVLLPNNPTMNSILMFW